MVLKFWNSSSHVLLAWILEEKKAVFSLSTKSMASCFMLSSICLCTVSFDLSQHLSAIRRSRFSLQNGSEILLNQGVGFRLRTVRWGRRACLSRMERSCLLKSVIGVCGVIDSARSCLKDVLSILLRERNCVVSDWERGLGMSSWHTTAMWSDVIPWWSRVERRRQSLCL